MHASTEKLYYVVCPPCHGATFLGLLLDGHPDISHLGDTIPKRKNFEALCSCGKVIKECPFWRFVAREVTGGPLDTSQDLLPRYPHITSRRRINKAVNIVVGATGLALRPFVWKLFGPAAEAYGSSYRALIRAANAWNGSRIFVDGGKSLTRLWVNRSIFPRASVRMIHLIRDPRAFYASNVKNWGDNASVEASCRSWKREHRFIRIVRKTLPSASYLSVRYEDLCHDPDNVLSSIQKFLAVELMDLMAIAKEGRHQHVIGSRTKKRFDGTIRYRERWHDLLSSSVNRSIIARTKPYSEIFGYAGD